jgi:hypothetical protein
MGKRDNNFRRSWNITKMCLLGTKGNWVVAPLENISQNIRVPTVQGVSWSIIILGRGRGEKTY